jgi:hypothetical protein
MTYGCWGGSNFRVSAGTFSRRGGGGACDEPLAAVLFLDTRCREEAASGIICRSISGTEEES